MTITKKQKTLFLLCLLVLITILIGSLLSPKREKNQENTQGSTKNNVGEYIVGNGEKNTSTVYGNVISTQTYSAVSSTAGDISSLNCQPGAEVKKGQIIATIAPANDLATENNIVQQSFLSQQVGLLGDGLEATIGNIAIEKKKLITQANTLTSQISLLEQNLISLQKQRELSSADTTLQLENAQANFDDLTKQSALHLDQITTSIANQKDALQNTVKASLDLFDKTFGISLNRKDDPIDIYLAAKNIIGKSQAISMYQDVDAQIDSVDTMSNEDVIIFMDKASKFFSLAADIIRDSIVDSRYLPQQQIDTLYSTFIGAANSVIQAKAQLDTTIAGYDTTKTTYDTQLANAQTNILSLKNNKATISDLSLSSQINQLQSQITSSQLSRDIIITQLDNFGNTEKLGVQSPKAQLLQYQQQLAILTNNLQGEQLYAPFDGIVRSLHAQENNKINPNTLICQISPRDTGDLKVQFYTTKDISLGSEVYLYNGIELIGSGFVDFMLPYKDTATQNNIYEITTFTGAIKEGQKISVQFTQTAPNSEIWVPVSYIIPRLEGYFVRKKNNGVVTEKEIIIGDIDGKHIRIMSGVSMGDTLIR